MLAFLATNVKYCATIVISLTLLNYDECTALPEIQGEASNITFLLLLEG